jgi:hypothetical protein
VVSQLKVNEIIKQSGSSITIGEAGDTAAGVFTNVPAFDVTMSSDQSISDNTLTKVQFNAVTFDTASAYDSSNYRYTPAIAGKYFVYSQINGYSGGNSDLVAIKLELRKNGSIIRFSYHEPSSNYGKTHVLNCTCQLDLTATDYLEVFGSIDGNSGGGEVIQGTGNSSTIFGAYRIIGA